MPEHQGADRVRYRFSPLERRGVIAGWRGGQIASVAVSLVVGVLALRSSPSLVGLVIALFGVGTGVALAFWPILGRTGEQWLPLVARWAWARSVGDGVQRAPGPRLGHEAVAETLTGGEAVVARPVTMRGRGQARPSVFAGLSVVAATLGAQTQSQSPSPSSEIGVVIDGPARTASAVLAVRGHSFALLGSADQDSRIAAWARVLSAMAREGSDVYRVQWIESCLPDDGSSLRRHWSDHAVLGTDTPAGRSYQALVDEASPVTRRHRVVVVLSVRMSRSTRSSRTHRSSRPTRSSRWIRTSGRDMSGVGVVLGREVLALHRALDGADISVEGVLGPAALSRVIGDAFAPGMDAPGPAAEPAAEPPARPAARPAATTSRWPWPMAVEPHWDSVRTDATWQATYWIAEWPRVDVTPDFLGPLLFSPLRRSIVLTMEPVSPSRAARQVAQARTADIADGELRRRGGFLDTARHAREKESAEERDTELADGHAQYRFSGYVTVTADSRDELDASRATLEQAAGQARIDLRLLFGEQDTAFACSLPLGRGLS
jgi:hypothetical protein